MMMMSLRMMWLRVLQLSPCLALRFGNWIVMAVEETREPAAKDATVESQVVLPSEFALLGVVALSASIPV